MDFQAWLKQNWPLAAAGGVALLGLVLYARRGASTATVSTGLTPQEVQAAEAAQTAQAQSSDRVKETFYTSLAGLSQALVGAEAEVEKTALTTASQVEIAKSNAAAQAAEIAAATSAQLGEAQATASAQVALQNARNSGQLQQGILAGLTRVIPSLFHSGGTLAPSVDSFPAPTTGLDVFPTPPPDLLTPSPFDLAAPIAA